MKVPNLMPKSRLTFSVPVIILVAVFFIGYYFYYIPVNKNDTHKNGFLILQNVKASILERNNDYQNLYKNFFDKFSGTPEDFQNLLDKNNIEGKAFPLFNSVAKQNVTDTTPGFSGHDNTTNEFQESDIQQNNIAYLFKNKTNAVRIVLPAENILNQVLQSQKSELFESYLLVDRKNGLIYKDPELSIVSHIPVDSLLPHFNSLIASVRDIKIQEVDYKIFSYPFHFGNDDVILCGFIKAKEYNARLREIPVSFIYPIVILFLILLIFLPIIKFYLIGSNETVKFIDLTLSAISFIVGPALITLILIQVLLLWSADIRARSNLDELSKQINSGFTKDLLDTYKQLDVLDSLIAGDNDSVYSKIKNGENINVSKQIISYFKSNKNTPGLDYNFDRIFWSDSTGQQKIKGQVEKEAPLFTNVSARKYFKVFKNNNAYILPGHPGSFFGFEPVNSWADGEFRIFISKESRLKRGFIVAIAARMPSVVQTILPPGFGFCIIDDSGNVQLHSEMNRNLQENIIEKMSPSRPIKESISSRQSSYFNELKFYGKTNAVSIIPISKIPFSLITFYDKGYIVPVTMRIFTFALLFCFFSFFIYFLIWIAFFRKHYYVNPMLYSPMVFLKWAIPKKEFSEFYVTGKRFLIWYIIVLLLFMAFSGLLGITNYVILVLVLLTPANVISSLFVISYSAKKTGDNYDRAKAEKRRRKARRAIEFQLLSNLIIYFYSRYFAYPIEYQFLIFQGILMIAILGFYFSLWKKITSSPEKYVSQYSGLATVIILCIGVVPAGLYTWYAHNQEITQSVKKGQLYLAESLQKRSPSIVKFINNQDSLEVPGDYYQKLQYQSGIYKIYNDSLIRNDSLFHREQESYEQFYFAIANDIGNNYYDPLLLPALKDTASDLAWYWSRSGSKLFFRYGFPDNFLSGNKSLNIISAFPERYKFVGISFRSLILVLIVILLIRGLYILLGSVAVRIFLKKFIEINSTAPHESKIPHLLEEFNKTYATGYPGVNDITKLNDEYNYYTPPATNALIYLQEKDMIDALKKLKPFYDFLWQKCTEKEKYILLDFAKDGLVNFKNSGPIYSLLVRGLFTIHDHEIKLMSPSFRAYVLEKKNTTEMYQMQKKFQQNSTWQSFRIPVLIILLGIALFIFFTQEETFQKLTAIVAGVSSVLSLLLKFFVDGKIDVAKK
jgi:hypothetical protein